MSGLLLVLGAPAALRRARVVEMAARAPHRGAIEQFHELGAAAAAVQNRAWGGSSSRAGVACDAGVMVAAVGGLTDGEHLHTGEVAARRVLGLYRRSREALLAARGPCSFALYDAARGHLMVRRDPLGQRPIFYWHRDDLLVVASEIKQVVTGAARSCPVSEAAVLEALRFGDGDVTRTCFSGVRRLLGGHCLELDRGRQRVWRYYDPPGPEARAPTLAEAGQALRQNLARALRREGPVDAVLMSGGIDSTVVAAEACAVADQQGWRRPEAVSAIYPWLPEVDESEYIRLTARHLGMRLHTTTTRPRPFDDLDALVARHDGPCFPPMVSSWRQLIAHARQLGFRQLVDGHDGDTIFGTGRRSLAALVYSGRWSTALARLRRFRQAAGLSWPAALWRAAGSLRPDCAPRSRIAPVRLPPAGFMRPAMGAAIGAASPVTGSWGEIQRLVLDPITSLMLEALELEDLAAGVETAHPLYEQSVVELCLQLPPEVKLAGGWVKGVARAAYSGALPAALLQRADKTSFERLYLSGCNRESLDRALCGASVPEGWLARSGPPLPLTSWEVLHPLCRLLQGAYLLREEGRSGHDAIHLERDDARDDHAGPPAAASRERRGAGAHRAPRAAHDATAEALQPGAAPRERRASDRSS
jgi:asparagine synthase (glutamine-hydrolysing)